MRWEFSEVWLLLQESNLQKYILKDKLYGKMELTIQFDGGWGNIALIYILYKH